ncbi:MAG: hypothetical protein R3B47_09895 [Bacteroidia bacterium]
MLIIIAIVNSVANVFFSGFIKVDGLGYAFSYVLSNAATAAVLLLLFQPIHQAAVKSLFFLFDTIRLRHLVLGLVAGLIIYLADPLVSILFHEIKSVEWENDPGALFKGGVAAIFLGIGYATGLLVQMGYLLPALTKWTKRPLVAVLIIWIYANWGYMKYVLSIDNIISIQSIQFIIATLPFLYIMACWVILDDGLELIVGLVIGGSIIYNLLIKLGNGVGGWGSTLVEVFLQGDGFGFWIGSLARLVGIFLVSLYFYRKIPWSNVRSRLFSLYQKPAIHDEWGKKIEEIGNEEIKE